MNKLRIYAVIFLVCSAVQGCNTPQVPFPDGAQKTEFLIYDVAGRTGFNSLSGKCTFGGYGADWTRTEIMKKPGTREGEDITVREQAYTVDVKGPDGFTSSGKYESRAEVEVEGKKVTKTFRQTSTTVYSSTLRGSLKTGSSRAYDLNLSLDITNINHEIRGKLTGKGVSLDISSTNKSEGAWDAFFITGFYIHDAGKLVAVVEVSGDGRVYIAKNCSREQSQLIAAVSSMLLSYQDISK